MDIILKYFPNISEEQKKQFAALILAILPAFTFAAGPAVHLDKVDIDLTDKAAMQDGLKTFANYCMGCHGAKFQRYERVANDLGISEELMMMQPDECESKWRARG